MRSPSKSRRPARSLLEVLETRVLFNTLVVNGTPDADMIVLAVTDNGGVKVTLNGTTTSYQPDQWTNVAVNTNAGDDSVTVEASVVPIAIVNGGGKDVVNVGHGSLGKIAADVTVGSLRAGTGSGEIDLTVDGSNDTTAAQFTVSAANPVGPADNPFGTIAFRLGNNANQHSVEFDATQTSSVTIAGGSGGNGFAIQGIPAGPSVAVMTGAGDDAIGLLQSAVGNTLTINGGAGDDTLTAAPFNAAGGNVVFDGGDGNNSVVLFGALLPVAGATSAPAPGADAITLTTGQAKRGDATISYTHTQTLQVEEGTFEANGDLGNIKLVVGSAFFAVPFPVSVDVNANQTLSALDIESGVVTLNGSATLRTDSLAFTVSALPIGGINPPRGHLDVGSSRLDVHYADTDPFAQIRTWIFQGAIVSGKSDGSHNVGYADSADGVVHGLANHTVLAQFALDGDTNLDNNVNFDDLLRLAQNYGKHENANWDQGDFNYDGQVDFQDLLKLAQNYGKSLGGSQTTAGALAVVAADTLPPRKRR